VVLLVPLKLDTNAAPGGLELKATISWLECESLCLPASAEARSSVKIGPASKPSADAALIASWARKLPQPGDRLKAAARWDQPINDGTRLLSIEWDAPPDTLDPDFVPYGNEAFEVQGPTKILAAAAGKFHIQKEVKKIEGDWPEEVAGLIVSKLRGQTIAWTVRLPIKDANGARAVSSSFAANEVLDFPLWKMLLYAFLGGLILNVMPCVLPVIALKILGFVGQSQHQPGTVRKLGLLYGAGVLFSFLLLAALVLGLKAAGHKAGWGLQFGNAQFLVVMTAIVTLVALNLFGLFEINPGTKVMSAAGNLAAKEGPAGAFLNGVLATVLATPCTAPFLAPAAGFALAPNQNSLITVLVLLTVGVGLASPYVVLSWHPAWLKFVPKPGAWMERFKVAMGFPMLATAVWLSSLTVVHYGDKAWWLGIFLVLVALAAWIYGEFVQSGISRWIGGLAVVVILGLAFAYVLEGQLAWRKPIATTATTTKPAEPGAIAWEKWSPEAVTRARSEGRPVLVDFTADWCLICQANKKFAIEVPQVRDRLKAINAVALIGDYTLMPDDISAELTRYGRAGVPLVLVYPKSSSAPPLVLPSALTSGIVLDALDKAAK
jgi:thiol:disulfide interchange protein